MARRRQAGSSSAPPVTASERTTGLSRLVFAVAENAVPAGGWFLGGWSPGTALAVYWFENLVSTLTLGTRIAVHRRATRMRGHRDQNVRAFLPVVLAFTIVHGVFVGVALGLAKIGPVDWNAVVAGARGVLCAHAASLVFDWFTIARWPFAEIRRRTGTAFVRLGVVHLGLLIGMFVAFAYGAPASFFTAFVVLRAMAELSSVLPQWQPEEPPRVLAALFDRFPTKPGEESFSDYWRRSVREERTQHARDEQVM